MGRFIVFLVLVTIQMVSRLVGAISVYGDTIYYPPTEPPGYDMPDACFKMDYCLEKGDNYPQSKIDVLLENVPEALDRLLHFRQSVYTKKDDDPNCPVDTTYTDKPIYYVRDKHGEVRAVVQSPSKFLQTYSTKICKRQGRITADTPDLDNTTFVSSHILRKFNITCVQQEVEFDFFVLNEVYAEPRMEVVTTHIPVHCRCEVHDLPKKN